MSYDDELRQLPRFCTFSQTASYLGVSRSTVSRYVAKGALQAWSLESGRRKIPRTSIARLVGLPDGQVEGGEGGNRGRRI